VTAFRSSLEALTVFHENSQAFDLVISDMTMPDMTGDELARRVIEIRGDIPFILCTGYNSRIDEESAKAIGIKAFVFKPVTLINLATTIRNVMDGKADAFDGDSYLPATP
jgi:CheY-like chemotaxis protein